MNNITNLCLTIISAFSLSLLMSCANGGAASDENILGVYKVVDRDCRGSALEIEACQAIVFIEFVKGHFYKVADNEVAFVVWSGEKGEDLTYAVRKYKGSITFDKGQVIAAISDDDSFKETVSFANKTGSYSIENIQSGVTIKSQLVFKKAQPADLAKYLMEYPGKQ